MLLNMIIIVNRNSTGKDRKTTAGLIVGLCKFIKVVVRSAEILGMGGDTRWKSGT